MLFNSFSFGIFLPIVFVLYWMIPHKLRWVILLTASYYFYMSWNAKYIVLILFTTLVSFVSALLMEKFNSPKCKKWLLFITLLVCLGVLFFFKYFNFVSLTIFNTLNAIAIPVHPITLKVMLPVGISFYTFQTLSYVIDVYYGKVKPERHFGYYAAFISFFPQLVAGPIERSSNLLPQIKRKNEFDYTQGTYGMKLMAWGFFKKMVIADTVAIYVDKIFDNINEFTGLSLVIAIIFFAIQIYCDFSGYSDIAIGCAKIFGIDLMTNFKSPYFSASIREFWSRWHISLSTWFRDYVYIPLGGNRVSKARHNANIMTTFLVSGLWHGASWNFVLWGGIHGGLQVIESRIFGKRDFEKRNSQWFISVVFTTIFVVAAWVFFRADTFKDAIYFFKESFKGISDFALYRENARDILEEIYEKRLLRVFIPIGILICYDFASLKTDVIKVLSNSNVIIRWLVYIIIVLSIVFFSPISGGNEFIYFQF